MADKSEFAADGINSCSALLVQHCMSVCMTVNDKETMCLLMLMMQHTGCAI